MVRHKKNETNPIAREPRLGGDRQTDGQRIFKYRRVLILGRKMSDCKSERVNITFLIKLKKSAIETFQLLTEAYGEVSCLVQAFLNGTNDFRKAEKASFEVQGHVDCFL